MFGARVAAFHCEPPDDRVSGIRSRNRFRDRRDRKVFLERLDRLEKGRAVGATGEVLGELGGFDAGALAVEAGRPRDSPDRAPAPAVGPERHPPCRNQPFGAFPVSFRIGAGWSGSG